MFDSGEARAENIGAVYSLRWPIERKSSPRLDRCVSTLVRAVQLSQSGAFRPTIERMAKPERNEAVSDAMRSMHQRARAAALDLVFPLQAFDPNLIGDTPIGWCVLEQAARMVTPAPVLVQAEVHESTNHVPCALAGGVVSHIHVNR